MTDEKGKPSPEEMEDILKKVEEREFPEPGAEEEDPADTAELDDPTEDD